MDIYAKLIAIRRVHSLAIQSIEDGDSEGALRQLVFVESELVVLSEVAAEHLAELRTIARQQREALQALRDGRLADSLALGRAVLAELTLAEENISRGRNPADSAAILPN